MSEIERTRKALHEAEETIEQLRGLLRECVPHIDKDYPINASADDLASMIGSKPFLHSRVRKELGE